MIILASTSPRRIEILQNLNIKFTSVSPIFEEDHENSEYSYIPAHLIPIIFAHEKTDSIYDLYPNDIVIGADTIVTLDDKVLGKPKNEQESVDFLLSLSAREHYVITGVSIMSKKYNLECNFSETSRVIFKSINTSTAEKYISLVHTLDKAGGYAIQENSELVIEKYYGEYNNIVGLPTKKLIDSIENIASIYAINK